MDGSEVTGTPWGMGRLITFSGSGDLDNGMTMGFFSSMNDSMSGISSSAMSIGLFWKVFIIYFKWFKNHFLFVH